MATMTVSEDSSFAPGKFGQYQSSRFVTTPGLKTASPSNSSSMGEQDSSDKAAAAAASAASATHASIKSSQLSSASSTSAATPQFGVLDLSPQCGVLGPPKDGRVSRDAVPTKLKGKMDQKNGNFGVMHMDIGTRVEPMKQSVAAQRTSENTALAAEVAQREGYISLKKRRLEASKPPFPGTQVLRPQPAPVIPPYAPRNAPLTPEQAKYEQARLLTLLRSITPLTVVDQLCKALAFFGGIPSAPPPADGRFPQSAEANGEGKLFLGWISEIFPDLERKGGWKKEEPAVAPDLNTGLITCRRPRGRPKGSKARKVRSDKGIKKGPLGATKKDAQGNPQDHKGSSETANGEADDGWVDVGDGDAHNAASNDADAMDVDVLQVVEPAANTSKPDMQNKQEQQSTLAAVKNKGGRPRGSRNKPKSTESTSMRTQGQAADSGLELPTPPPGVMQVLARTLADVQTGGGVSSSPNMETPDRSQRIKNKGGRPKGSKNKPKDGQASLPTPVSSEMMGEPQSAVESPSRRGTRYPNNTSIGAFAAVDQTLTSEEVALLAALRKVRAMENPAPAPAPPPPETKKRKRAPRPSAASKAAASGAATSVNTVMDASAERTSGEPSAVNGGTQAVAVMPENQGQSSLAGSAPPAIKETMPPNKAQRSAKDGKQAANKRQSSQNLQSGGMEKLSETQNSRVSTSMSSPQLSLPATSTPTQSLNTQVQPKRPSSQTSQHYQPQQHHFTSLNANHNQSQSQAAAQVAMQVLQQSQNRQAQQSPIQTANTTATYFSQPHQPAHAITRPSSTHTTSYSPYSSIPNLQQNGRQFSHSHSLSDSLQNDGSVSSNPYASPSISTNSGGVQSGNVNVGSNQGNNGRNSLAAQQHGTQKQHNSFSTSSNSQNVHSSAQNSRHQQNSQGGLAGVVPQQNSHNSGTGQSHNAGQERNGSNGSNANTNPYSYGYTDTAGYLDLGSNSSGGGHSHINNNNHSHTMSNSLSDGALGHGMFHSNQVGVNRGAGTAAGGISDIGFGGNGGSVSGAYDMVQGGMTDNDIREKLLGGMGRR